MLDVATMAAPRLETVRPPGCGTVEVARAGAASAVTRAFASSPLRLLTPRNHGTAAWVYTSTYGGGLVGGDCLSLDVRVGSGAACFLSTQASTKVYRSPLGASSRLTARVDDRGLLVVVPDPVVCFARSGYRQVQRLDLAASADLVLVDWLTSGRRASGERWAFDEYANRLQVFVDDVLARPCLRPSSMQDLASHSVDLAPLRGASRLDQGTLDSCSQPSSRSSRLVVHDALTLRPAEGPLARRLGSFDALATLVLLGPRVSPYGAALATAVSRLPARRHTGELVAASDLQGAGWVLRLAGRSADGLGRSLRGYLDFVPALLGDDPWTRKW